MGTKLPSSLAVGDRVSRFIELGKPERRNGVITDIYRTKPGYGATPRRLFAVKWDNGSEERGFFEEGLQKE